MAKATGKIQLAITPDRTIEADLRDIPLSQLKFDPNNVRFMHMRKRLIEKQIEDWMWDNEDLRELYNEIKWSQGLTHPLVVDHNYTTKEGNRRLACLRKLATDARNGNISVPVEKFDPVPCYVLPENIEGRDIAVYLARVHVSGERTWGAINKAAHIYDIYYKYGLTFDDIKNAISMSKQTVINNAKAFKATTEYGEKYGDEKWIEKFSYFLEFFKRKKLREWAESDGKIQEFKKWVYEGKFRRGEDVRMLPSVLENEDAYRAFLKGGMEAAERILDELEPARGSRLFKLIDRTIGTLNILSRDEQREIVESKKKLEKLKEMHSDLGEFIKELEAVRSVAKS